MKEKETLEQVAGEYAKEWEEIHGLNWDNLNLTPEQISQLDFKSGAKWQQEKELDKLKEALEIIRKFVNEFDEEGEVSYNTRDEAEIFLTKQQEQ